MTKKEKLLEEALELTALEKSEIIEQLMMSLDQPDREMDSLWKKEVEHRIDAYNEGKMGSVTVQEAFKKYTNR
jgi:putative addiction module component (TIGR02574 family)